MLKGYKLTITQKGPKADKELKNVFESTDQIDTLEKLARCFRDINVKERARAIKRASHTYTNVYDDEKRGHKFIIEYDVHSDHSIITVYNWEFFGDL